VFANVQPHGGSGVCGVYRQHLCLQAWSEMSLQSKCVKKMHLLEHPVRHFSAAKATVSKNMTVCNLISIKRTNVQPFCRTGVAKPLSLPDHTSPLAFTDKSFGTASRALIDALPSLQAAVAARCISEIVLNTTCNETLGLVQFGSVYCHWWRNELRECEEAKLQANQKSQKRRSRDGITRSITRGGAL
jgi:hypothetical protein